MDDRRAPSKQLQRLEAGWTSEGVADRCDADGADHHTICLAASSGQGGLKSKLQPGASLQAFEQTVDTWNYLYTPTENYQLQLEIKFGEHYKQATPPALAVWLENSSGYHVKTLLAPSIENVLPYWQWKVAEYEKAKNEAEAVDAMSSATPNASFDPRDYILPERNTEPFFMVVEVDEAGDANDDYSDQPSILYRVEIDNAYPSYFQVLKIVGYTQYDVDTDSWDAYFPDGRLSTALGLIDSALLTIER